MNIDLGNYTGPYWSDGKLQTSVLFGESDAINALDELSRLHDSAYAFYPDRAHREAADRLYAQEARKLTGMFPSIAGNVVQYGNYAVRQGGKLFDDVKTFGFLPGIGTLLGAAKFVGGNILNSQKMINGTYLKKETEDVKSLYGKDPRKSKQIDLDREAPVNVAQRKRTSNKVEPQPMPGPSKKDIDKAVLVGRQTERLQNHQKLYKEANESNLNFAGMRKVQQSVDRVEKGRLSRAVQNKKKKKNKFVLNKVCPQ